MKRLAGDFGWRRFIPFYSYAYNQAANDSIIILKCHGQFNFPTELPSGIRPDNKGKYFNAHLLPSELPIITQDFTEKKG